MKTCAHGRKAALLRADARVLQIVLARLLLRDGEMLLSTAMPQCKDQKISEVNMISAAKVESRENGLQPWWMTTGWSLGLRLPNVGHSQSLDTTRISDGFEWFWCMLELRQGFACFWVMAAFRCWRWVPQWMHSSVCIAPVWGRAMQGEKNTVQCHVDIKFTCVGCLPSRGHCNIHAQGILRFCATLNQFPGESPAQRGLQDWHQIMPGT